MKVVITLMACVTAMTMIGFGLYGFTLDLKMWGAPIIGGMIIGGVTLVAAYNEL
jgi:hypothetical protein